ncbi:ATP-binding protein [Streptosporangium sp. CA-135522]|uniref:ATP-binding protein n=1 Tax=Streptosporangium sp. CA-135522 TaxID=3240072 RepID=UPI003D8CD3F8
MNPHPGPVDGRTNTPRLPAGSPSFAVVAESHHVRRQRWFDAVLSRFAGLAAGQDASWRLTPKPSSARRARRLARAWLAYQGLDAQSEVAELLISELVTNALRHTHGTIRLALSFEDGLLRCEVEDADGVPPRPRQARDDDEAGRGLHLIEQLSCCWGSARTSTGKVVWFELPASIASGN